MRVILQEKIKKLGNIGDMVTVKAGFARNFLLRQGKALPATEANVAVVEARRSELERIDSERKAKAQVKADALHKVGALELTVMCNAEGRLFGALNLHDVLKLLEEKGLPQDKSKVSVVGSPIRKTGSYEVHIECHAEITAVLPLHVRSQEPLETESSDKEEAKSEHDEQEAGEESSDATATD